MNFTTVQLQLPQDDCVRAPYVARKLTELAEGIGCELKQTVEAGKTTFTFMPKNLARNVTPLRPAEGPGAA